MTQAVAIAIQGFCMLVVAGSLIFCQIVNRRSMLALRQRLERLQAALLEPLPFSRIRDYADEEAAE
jgi:hypothetical protein